MKNIDELTIDDLPPSKDDGWWKEHNDEYYHYLYRIDNTINGMYYYGIHSQRKDSGKLPENDGYMGSGVRLRRAQRKYGLDKFTKSIIKTFSTRDEARLEERKIVNEITVKDEKCYNIAIGGGLLPVSTGFSTYKNKNNFGDTRQLSVNDPLVLSGEYIPIGAIVNAGYSTYKNKDNPKEVKRLHISDPLVVSGQFINVCKGVGSYVNKDNKNDIRRLPVNDPLVSSGQFISIGSGTMKKGGLTYRNLITKERKFFNENERKNIDNNLWKPDFLFSKDLRFITIELLENLYKSYNNSWGKVSISLGISTNKLRRVREYYRDLGYNWLFLE